MPPKIPHPARQSGVLERSDGNEKPIGETVYRMSAVGQERVLTAPKRHFRSSPIN
jgi:hypothetical protein